MGRLAQPESDDDFNPTAASPRVDRKPSRKRERSGASNDVAVFDASHRPVASGSSSTAPMSIDPALQYPPHLVAMMGGVVSAPPPGAVMSYLPPTALPPAQAMPMAPVASGSGQLQFDTLPTAPSAPPTRGKGGKGASKAAAKGKARPPNSRQKPPPPDPNMPLPDGFTYEDLVPRVYTDDVTGEEVYPCPNCPKKYTGKHARSIWRRHLQDKHAIPLAAQPRRTRWDNDQNRPKSDVERRERTLESKRRWARKNRASQRARTGADGSVDEGMDDGGSNRSMSPDSVTRANTLAVPAVLLQRSLSSASAGSNASYVSTTPTSRSPSEYGDGDVFDARPPIPPMLQSEGMGVMASDGGFGSTDGQQRASAQAAAYALAIAGHAAYQQSFLAPPPPMYNHPEQPAPPTFAHHQPMDASPPPAPLIHRTVSSGPAPHSSLSLQIAAVGHRVGPGPLSAPLFPTTSHDEFFGPQPSPPSGVNSQPDEEHGGLEMDEDDEPTAAISRRRSSTPAPPEQRVEEASLLLGLKTGSSPVSAANTTVEASFAGTDYSFRLPSSPQSSPAPSSKPTPATPGDNLISLPHSSHLPSYHHTLPSLMPHLPVTTSSSPWPSTPRHGVLFPGHHQLPPPPLPDEFKRHGSSPSGPPSGFLLSSPANVGLSAELGLAPSHYDGSSGVHDEYHAHHAATQQAAHHLHGALGSSAIKPRSSSGPMQPRYAVPHPR